MEISDFRWLSMDRGSRQGGGGVERLWAVCPFRGILYGGGLRSWAGRVRQVASGIAPARDRDRDRDGLCHANGEHAKAIQCKACRSWREFCHLAKLLPNSISASLLVKLLFYFARQTPPAQVHDNTSRTIRKIKRGQNDPVFTYHKDLDRHTIGDVYHVASCNIMEGGMDAYGGGWGEWDGWV